MRRVMCVWSPLWPIQRLRSAGLKSSDGSGAPCARGVRGEETRAQQVATSAQQTTSVVRGSPDLAQRPAEGLPSESIGKQKLPESTEHPPMVIFAEGRRGFQVTVCSHEASKWGIRVGMPLGEAQSLLPVSSAKTPRPPRRNGAQRGKPPALPVLKRADPAADRSRLQELALHCQTYSPLVGIEEALSPESLWLDISGSEVLFGGERGLAEKLQDDLAQQGVQVRVAVADSWGAAWGVSHYGEADISLVPPGQQTDWLSPLSIAALRRAYSQASVMHSGFCRFIAS